MRARRAALLGALGVLTAGTVQAREYETDVRIETLQDLYELERSGELESESVRILEALIQRPMNLNRADRGYLYDLPGVSYELADAIIARRNESGSFASLEELLSFSATLG